MARYPTWRGALLVLIWCCCGWSSFRFVDGFVRHNFGLQRMPQTSTSASVLARGHNIAHGIDASRLDGSSSSDSLARLLKLPRYDSIVTSGFISKEHKQSNTLIYSKLFEKVQLSLTYCCC
jgi:hypothetical protein